MKSSSVGPVSTCYSIQRTKVLLEQEITGDVLLELDVNLLKTEIGIFAYGKRIKVANAITDLRRPPSIQYSDRPDLSPSSPLPASPGLFAVPSHHSHSRTQSLSQSHHSYPGADRSLHNSVNSNGMAQFAHVTALLSPESAPHTGDLAASPRFHGFQNGVYSPDGLPSATTDHTLVCNLLLLPT